MDMENENTIELIYSYILRGYNIILNIIFILINTKVFILELKFNFNTSHH